VGQIAGLAVDYRYYDSPATQRATLTDVIRRLLADGIKATDIVVLSNSRLANSGIAGIDGGTDFKLAEVADVERSRVPVVRFATVQAFKGMESPVIVLCDVAQVSENGPQSLLYVAMSRARSQLTVLVDERARTLIRECLRRRLEMLKKL
jgi:DNA helicase IV